jgi:hypothetical protein
MWLFLTALGKTAFCEGYSTIFVTVRYWTVSSTSPRTTSLSFILILSVFFKHVFLFVCLLKFRTRLFLFCACRDYMSCPLGPPLYICTSSIY